MHNKNYIPRGGERPQLLHRDIKDALAKQIVKISHWRLPAHDDDAAIFLHVLGRASTLRLFDLEKCRLENNLS
jgi:hypothetical protein